MHAFFGNLSLVTPTSTSEAAGTTSYVLAGWLFLRLLGLIYFAAFVSLATQIKGLVGSQGVLPVAEFLASRRGWGVHRFYRVPTLCWWNGSDGFLGLLSWGGALLSLLLVVGIAPMLMLTLLWVVYLSLFNVGRIFLAYQWDILLLETGFLAIFLAPAKILPDFPPAAAPPTLIRWLLWWLLFRLMFSSGFVKFRSGDEAWRRLTALRHHHQTQPLPTPPAWYAHQLPLRLHKLTAALLFLIELFVPFLIVAPPPLRHIAAVLFIVLMLLIHLTGNYCFFNLLGIALSVMLLDDKLLEPVFRFTIRGVQVPMTAPPGYQDWIAVPIALLILVLSVPTICRLIRIDLNWPGPLHALFELLEPFRLVNGYGLFSVMTTERPEIIVEGSHDGMTWQSYEFKWKPCDVQRAPQFVAPHQPRLDWQMWFAALGYYPDHPWFRRFLLRLLEGSPSVLSLLRHNPFADAPPRFVRGVLYDYQFTNRAQRRAMGAWWRRERRGVYSPILELKDFEKQ